MLNKIAGPFQIKQYIHWASHALALGQDLQEDLSFVRTLRYALLPIPYLDRDPVFDTDIFPPLRPFAVEALAGKKIGIVVCGANVDPDTFAACLARGRDGIV